MFLRPGMASSEPAAYWKFKLTQTILPCVHSWKWTPYVLIQARIIPLGHPGTRFLDTCIDFTNLTFLDELYSLMLACSVIWVSLNPLKAIGNFKFSHFEFNSIYFHISQNHTMITPGNFGYAWGRTPDLIYRKQVRKPLHQMTTRTVLFVWHSTCAIKFHSAIQTPTFQIRTSISPTWRFVTKCIHSCWRFCVGSV